ncbi:FG-GAP repeat protein [Halosimplex aquaticum]
MDPTGDARSPDGGDYDRFGYSVALDGDTALVGAPDFEAPDGDTIGKAYLFERADGEWNHRTTLTPTADHDDQDYFGSSVVLDGDTALVASWGDDDPNGFYAGSAYAFERIDGRWIMDTKLVAADGSREDVFGSSIALDGDTALVGAEHDDEPNGDNAGSAYLFGFEGGEWDQQTKLLPDHGDSPDLFGSSAAVANGRGFVGAIYKGSNGTDKTGAVYVFST